MKQKSKEQLKNRIKVRAVKKGYYNDKIIQPGEVFFINDEEAFSDAHRPDKTEEGILQQPGWMEKVESIGEDGRYAEVDEDGETVTKKVKQPSKHPRAGKTSPDDEGVTEKKDFGRKIVTEDGDVI